MSALSEADREITRKVLANIEAVCNVRFFEVPDTASSSGVLRYAYSQRPTRHGLFGLCVLPRRRPTSAATSGLAAPRPAWNGPTTARA
jgi:hypothetical protein